MKYIYNIYCIYITHVLLYTMCTHVYTCTHLYYSVSYSAVVQYYDGTCIISSISFWPTFGTLLHYLRNFPKNHPPSLHPVPLHQTRPRPFQLRNACVYVFFLAPCPMIVILLIVAAKSLFSIDHLLKNLLHFFDQF